MIYTLITGASSGIGKAIAYECGKRGMNMILVSLPDQNLAMVAQDLTDKFKVKTVLYETDLIRLNSPKELYEWTQAEGYDINILINNAGVGGASYFEESTMDYIDERILLNIRALVMLTRLYLPVLCKHKESYILNVSSLAAFFYIPYKSIYSASKAFVLNFSRALSGELEGKGVSISVLFPNGVRTNDTSDKRVKAHGLIGQWTEIKTADVASSAIKGMFKKRFYIIPGTVNYFLLFLRLILPVPIQQRLISREFIKEAKATCVPDQIK